jgi:hypothetical protein
MNDAARSKRKRARDRAGEMVVPVLVNHDDTDTLMDMGLLGAWDERNREAIAASIKKLLAVTRGDLPESDLLDTSDSDSLSEKRNDRVAASDCPSHPQRGNLSPRAGICPTRHRNRRA